MNGSKSANEFEECKQRVCIDYTRGYIVFYFTSGPSLEERTKPFQPPFA